MNLSDGKCHLCRDRNNFENLEHLFFRCSMSKIIIKEIEEIFKISGILDDLIISEENMILGVIKGTFNQTNIVNTVIFYSKWEIWKFRNKIKYDKIPIQNNSFMSFWRNGLKNNLSLLLKTTTCNNEDKQTIQSLLTVL